MTAGNQNKIFHQPPLPYAPNALEGFVSEEQLFDFHYGKHHAAYFANLNKLIDGTPWADKTLEDVVRESQGGIFNNAAQAWNHSFFWDCLSPSGGGAPTGPIAEAIVKNFGDYSTFKEKFASAAATLFGAGWAWLAQNSDGSLEIWQGANADTPLRHGKKPILTLDVWEHAYYIDYRNARPKFIDTWWDVVNWDFANKNLS
jgi:Fe-Mn family superoxide dismutase